MMLYVASPAAREKVAPQGRMRADRRSKHQAPLALTARTRNSFVMSAEHERKILDNIEEHGWFCTSVFDPDQIKPSFSYSVGFTKTLNAPEFIVFGLNVKLMHSMLWRVFNDIKAGRSPEDGARWSGLLEGHECIIRAVHPTNVVPDYFNSAIWLWEDRADRGPLSAFQIVWPGAATNLYPWDQGCPEIVRDAQPALYLPNTKLH